MPDHDVECRQARYYIAQEQPYGEPVPWWVVRRATSHRTVSVQRMSHDDAVVLCERLNHEVAECLSPSRTTVS